MERIVFDKVLDPQTEAQCTSIMTPAQYIKCKQAERVVVRGSRIPFSKGWSDYLCGRSMSGLTPLNGIALHPRILG